MPRSPPSAPPARVCPVASWTYAKNATIDAWHDAKCVSRWTDRFNDTNKCVGYLAAKYTLADTADHGASPSLEDLRGLCAAFREHTDVDFVEALCEASNEAMAAVWERRFSRDRP